MSEQVKVCSKCGVEKLLSDFHKQKGGKHGVKSHCKVCRRQWREENREKIAEYERKYREENRDDVLRRTRQWREENPDKIAEYRHQYYEENCEKIAERRRQWREDNRDKELERTRQWREENPDKIAEYMHQYYEENREKIAERNRQYRKENPRKIRERNRKWAKANPDKIRVYHHRRRALKRNAKGRHTTADIQEVYKAQGGICAGKCNEPLPRDYHVDHWIPLSKGGRNDAGNLRLMCPACNLSKGAKDPHEWSGRLL